MKKKISGALVTGLIASALGIAALAAGDSDYVRAERYLDQIESGLSDLQPGDFDTYNSLSAKATETRTHLEQTASKEETGYSVLTDRWNAVAQQLTDIQTLWTNSSVMQPDHPILKLNGEVVAFINNPALIDESTSAKHVEFENRLAEFTADPNYAVVAQNIAMLKDRLPGSAPRVSIDKYNPRNWPELKPGASGADQRIWIESMLDLFGDQLRNDERMMAEDVAAGRAQHNDQVRFNAWAKDTWKSLADTKLSGMVQTFNADVRDAVDLANRIDRITADDKDALVNIASEQAAERNSEALHRGLRALEVARHLDAQFANNIQPRDEQEAALRSSLAKLDELRTAATQESQRRAALPKVQKKTSGQKLWMDGRVAAEITKAGAVWINSNRVGDIEDNGKIWVGGSVKGQFEDDGDVWHDGRNVGTLGDDRRVWVGGSPVGMIDEDGKVWIGGSAKGSVEGDGDWRRAAIVYYFSFF